MTMGKTLSKSHENLPPKGDSATFPGPLMSNKLKLEDLVKFIQNKIEECQQHLEKPEQREAYVYWKLMERFCKNRGNVNLHQVAALLFKEYILLRKKLGGVKEEDDYFFELAQLLWSNGEKEQTLYAAVKLGEKLYSEGRTYAAHLCYVVALKKLSLGSSFELIGCNSLPVSQTEMTDAIERTEVYEYVCSLTSGLAQPTFQIYKCYYAINLFNSGSFDKSFEYCEVIGTAIATFPSEIMKKTMKYTIELSERLDQVKGEEPEWLIKLCELYTDKMFKPDTEWGLHFPLVDRCISPHEFKSLYSVGKLLGKGSFGSVCEGVHIADGKQVAIKCITKKKNKKLITTSGGKHTLPLEVALMEMVSKPFHCNKVLKLFEWFEMTNCYVLVLERPSPCVDVYEFSKCHKNRLPEPLACHIMYQVVQAVRHCYNCGVLHRDIKSENLLINTDTLEVKLIDFGCGDLVKDTPYTTTLGTMIYSPPEWIICGEYLGLPATIWSLGVLLFELVCAKMPFRKADEILYGQLHFAPVVSQVCRYLIWWCLEKDPRARPTLEEILNHQWFIKVQEKKPRFDYDTPNYNQRIFFNSQDCVDCTQ